MTSSYPPIVDAESSFFWPDVDPADTIGINGETPMELTDDEQVILGALKRQVTWAKKANRIKNEYYELKQRVRDLEISVPPQLKDVGVVVGWPGTVVDVLEERIDLMGFTSTGDLFGVDQVYDDNYLDLEFSRGTSDCLVSGISFFSIGKGDVDDGEPEVLVNAESPNTSTVLWDYRKRRAAAGLSQTLDTRNKVVMQSLYMPNRTITWAIDPADRNKSLGITSIDVHNLNRVMLVRQINKDRATNIHGRSEITPAVRYYTDAAVRTMLGMELNREFYTTPMRTALDVFPASIGITDDMSDDEKRRVGWSLLMGHMNIIPPQGDDSPMQQPRPQILQFPANPPTPYIDQVKAYSIQISAETGMPASFLGFVTDNPTSADSIDKSEYRLIRRAERRLQSYRQTCKEIALCAVLVRDGADGITLDDLRAIEPNFRDPSMPTRAAAADAAQKMVAAEILPPRSRVTWTKVGISPKDQDQLEIDWRKAQAEQLAQQQQQADMAMQQAQATAKIQAQYSPSAGGATSTGSPSSRSSVTGNTGNTGVGNSA